MAISKYNLLRSFSIAILKSGHFKRRELYGQMIHELSLGDDTKGPDCKYLVLGRYSLPHNVSMPIYSVASVAITSEV